MKKTPLRLETTEYSLVHIRIELNMNGMRSEKVYLKCEVICRYYTLHSCEFLKPYKISPFPTILWWEKKTGDGRSHCTMRELLCPPTNRTKCWKAIWYSTICIYSGYPVAYIMGTGGICTYSSWMHPCSDSTSKWAINNLCNVHSNNMVHAFEMKDQQIQQ